MKNTKMLVATIALFGAAVLAPLSAQAGTTGDTYPSKGVITYTPSTDPTDPVDPLKPVDPITPTNPDGEDPSEPGTAGPLSIDFASSFYFGEQTITSVIKTYNALPQAYKDKAGTDTTGPNFVQVTDNRGTEAGWTLKVTQDAQFKTTNIKAGTELEGAEITLDNGNVVTASHSTAPTGPTQIVLAPGAETLVMSAKATEGAGTYLFDWGTDQASAATSVSLEVPGSSTKYSDRYETNFTWVLSDVPGV
ncbi:WxL domain-containing protein [Enterococcus phoeniculicola]|uniref:WxL domain-containing protein n=1 Tax=Enterococcus phoeniculicola ATCC BAA-412 TaxID=1158610 RepID=R3U6P2_9ENTE|nr:WxL domain-containing protein [Enterococcus phoeniculicola]EOL49108.1 hypothetical protein UC3_00203 [Enterococcus phoeniculicola ATCC BAA-412]EOT70501.1 hypothetical protein I589_03576 [Enterococcus phoeniculicola ATCC BAA-412]EOT70774.1 hypothetical protein I589_03527 [Enterococcus phoeniculicola ATCC BAA-412]